ncbi:putative RNA-binding protein [Zalerion maritima]|uniref:RNA-binding protein n=1 Tax=Zalerion maritima TaxID=339359 RepID=A0AAD5WUM5_9PEZI|nr:putative RNA-binding protein [Zalerion maritima]
MAPELRTRRPKTPSKSAIADEKPKMKSGPVSTKRKAKKDSSPVTKKKPKTSKSTSAPKTKTLAGISEANESLSDVEDPSPFDDEEDERGADASSAMMKLIDSDCEDGDDGDTSDEGEKQVSKVPKVPKHQKPAKRQEKEEPGVVYVGRIPHGFYEHQMRAFFSQFGDINKLRLSRNKKTGASKHYAFIEFAEESTAEIVAYTMDNYQMYERILKVKAVSRDKVHPDLWKGCNRRYKIVPWKKLAAKKLKEPKTEDQWNKSVSRENKRRNKLAEKLKAIDYDFEMPVLAAPPKPAPLIAADGEGTDEEEVKAIEPAAEAGSTEQADVPEDKEKNDTEEMPAPVKRGKKAKQKKSKA